MKEATGELNMTVITLVAIAAIGAVFYFLVWPLVQRTIASNSCRTAYGSAYKAYETEILDATSQAKVKDWCCIPEGENAEGLEKHLLSTGDTNCTAGGTATTGG